MSSVQNNPKVYGQIERSYEITTADDDKPKKYHEKIILTMPEDQIKILSAKSERASKKDEKHSDINIIGKVTTAAALAIPLVHSVSTAAVAPLNTYGKTFVALQTAKSWTGFIGASVLFSGAANLLINKIKPLRKFRDENPVLTYAGLLVGAVLTGNKAKSYLYDNRFATTDINGKMARFSYKVSQNKTYKKAVENLSKFAMSNKGQVLGFAAIASVFVLAVNSLINLGRPKNKISE